MGAYGNPRMDPPGMDGPGMDGCQLICCDPGYLNSIMSDDSGEAENPLESLCENCECDQWPMEMPEFPEEPDFEYSDEVPEISGEYDYSEEYEDSEESKESKESK